MAPKWVVVFLDFLKHFVISFSWKKSEMNCNIVIGVSPPIPYLVLELWTKMLLTNQTAGFFKMKYLKKEVNDKVYFWYADKHRSFLQVDTIILSVRSQAYPKYPK